MRKNDTLQTPEWVYKALGSFDLDPCAGENTTIAEENWWIGRGEDGLNRIWHGFVWCNPPFSEKQKWIDKMMEHRNGILLLPERGSSAWFGPLVEKSNAHFVMGKRINFIGGSSISSVGSVLFAFGEEAVDRISSSGLPGHLNFTLFFNPRNRS